MHRGLGRRAGGGFVGGGLRRPPLAYACAFPAMGSILWLRGLPTTCFLQILVSFCWQVIRLSRDSLESVLASDGSLARDFFRQMAIEVTRRLQTVSGANRLFGPGGYFGLGQKLGISVFWGGGELFWSSSILAIFCRQLGVDVARRLHTVSCRRHGLCMIYDKAVRTQHTGLGGATSAQRGGDSEAKKRRGQDLRRRGYFWSQ